MQSNNKRFTEQQRIEIISKYKAGASAYGLGKEYGFHGSSVLSMLQKEKIHIRPKLFSIKEKEKFIEEYESGMSLAKIAKKYNRDIHSIHNFLKTQKVVMRKQKETSRKYAINENYFDIIDDEEKAYFLGFLYADGCNHKTGVISVAIINEDVDVLNKFRNLVSPTKPYTYPKRKKDTHRQQVCFSITSRHMSNKLNELGCMQRKSLILKFPTEEQVPSYLLKHWLRGLWDGDGSFYQCRRGKNRFGCNITSTLNICEGVTELLNKELGLLLTIYKRKNSEIRYLTISSIIGIYKFIVWLYENSTVWMDRKYIKSSEIIKILSDNKKIKELKC